MSTPQGGGPHIILLMSALVFTSVSVSHQLQREPLLNFFGRHVFLFPRALAFDFFYDLDIYSQGQAVRAFFVRMVFSLILSKVPVQE